MKTCVHIPAMLFLLLLGCSHAKQETPEPSAIDRPIATKEHPSVNPAGTLPNARKTIAKPEKKEPPNVRSVSEPKRLFPHVELNAGEWAKHHFEIIMLAGEWQGRPFRGIIPPSSITRIILVRDNGFASGNEVSNQRCYDALMDHLIESNETAREYGLLALEKPVATLVLLTKDGEIYLLEVLQTLGNGISSINISGRGKGARIEVKGYESNSSQRHLR